MEIEKVNKDNPNLMNYAVGDFDYDGKTFTVFLHELHWVISNRKLIPKGMLVAHRNGIAIDNDPNNLYLVPENKEFGDLHKEKILHEDNVNWGLIKEHFPDVYNILKTLPKE